MHGGRGERSPHALVRVGQRYVDERAGRTHHLRGGRGVGHEQRCGADGDAVDSGVVTLGDEPTVENPVAAAGAVVSGDPLCRGLDLDHGQAFVGHAAQGTVVDDR